MSHSLPQRNSGNLVTLWSSPPSHPNADSAKSDGHATAMRHRTRTPGSRSAGIISPRLGVRCWAEGLHRWGDARLSAVGHLEKRAKITHTHTQPSPFRMEGSCQAHNLSKNSPKFGISTLMCLKQKPNSTSTNMTSNTLHGLTHENTGRGI